MCDIDISVFGTVWINETHLRSWPDFNTKHVCKNFDDIRAWVERNQVPEEQLADLMERPEVGGRVWDEVP